MKDCNDSSDNPLYWNQAKIPLLLLYNVWNKCNLLRLWLEVKVKLFNYRSGWPLGTMRLRFQNFPENLQVCQPYVPAAFTPRTHPEGLIATRTIKSTNTSNDSIGNRAWDLPACSAVPQPTAPLNTSRLWNKCATIYVSASYSSRISLSETFCSFHYAGVASDPLYDDGKSKRSASVNRLQNFVFWYSSVSKANKVSSNLAELQEHGWDWGGNKGDDRQNVGFIDTNYLRE